MKGADLRKQFDDLAAFKATADSARLARPQKPEDYKAELPATFKPPEGMKFEIDAADPMIAQYRALAVEAGLDQATFSKGLGLIAAIRVGEAQQIKTAFDGEVAKLGASGPQRVDAVMTWLTAMGGEDAKPLAKILELAPVAGTVVALEKLMARFASQGAASFSQQHRSHDEPGKVSDEEYNRMSFAEQRAYAAKFPQPATNGAAR